MPTDILQYLGMIVQFTKQTEFQLPRMLFKQENSLPLQHINVQYAKQFNP